MKKIALTAITSVFNVLLAMYKKVCGIKPDDSATQEFIMFMVLLAASVGLCLLAFWISTQMILG